MSTVIAPKEYKNLLKRQNKIEAELGFLKKMVFWDDEKFIRPSILKKWEKISHDMDQGRGRFFDSVSEMKSWLKNMRRN